MIDKTRNVLVVLSVFCIAACQGGSEQPNSQPLSGGAVEPGPAVNTSGSTTAGKPTAPIDISYEVVGNAIVGMPVSINIVVTSPVGPVDVEYSIMDGSALIFQPGQVERLEITDPSSGSLQQLTVVPQREGRLYVNVSAEIQAADGLTIRSMAIPVKVGSAPQDAPGNGTPVEGPDGEQVISLPATESN